MLTDDIFDSANSLGSKIGAEAQNERVVAQVRAMQAHASMQHKHCFIKVFSLGEKSHEFYILCYLS